MKVPVLAPNAPRPIGPYSPGMKGVGALLYCSGQTPLDPTTGVLVEGDVAAQTSRVMQNLESVLRAAGVGFDHVVKTTVFLTDMRDFEAMNEVYGSYFQSNPPARTTVQVAGLPRGARVEIECIAALE